MTVHGQRVSYGDFQTPPALAEEMCRFIATRDVRPCTVIEPTCGVGNILLAAVKAFPTAQRVLGADLNQAYLDELAETVAGEGHSDRVELRQANFFQIDWKQWLDDLPDPILIVGNPPWVTNAALGVLQSDNLPVKRNARRLPGIEALTGRSNFDISEWMMTRLVEALQGRRGLMAMLCKTTVARRVLADAWQRKLVLQSAELHHIDARSSFQVTVAASLFVTEFATGSTCESASVFAAGSKFGNRAAIERIGWCDGRLVADLPSHARSRRYAIDPIAIRTEGTAVPRPAWRSGVKHDCAPVLELLETAGQLRNGLGEIVDIEPTCLYPLLKSGDIRQGTNSADRRWLLLPQRSTGENTEHLAGTAPRTWQYLLRHADRLESRRSSIYRRQPRFAIFGIGDYTFAPWKVAISGFAKSLLFHPIGARDDRPFVLDDACYFLPCATEQEAQQAAQLLNSPAAHDFFRAYVFWDAKRPITAEVLRTLDLRQLALDAKLPQSVDRPLDDSR